MSLYYTDIVDSRYTELLRTYTAHGKKAYIRTFGCQQNEADSEKIAGILKDVGYRITDTHENADLIILNTCSVRAHAEEKARSARGSASAMPSNSPSASRE